MWPATVLYVPGRGGGTVVCVCARARAAGVRLGLPLAEARALLDEHACFAPLDAVACKSALLRLAVWCQQFSPVVGIEEAELPECLLLDVTGCAPLFKGESSLLARIAGALRQRGLHARLALADTVGAAWAVAHFGRGECTLVPAGLHAEAVRGLPVEALRLPAETLRRLRDLDLLRIEQVQALPRACLPARFGPELLCRLDQALGALPEPIRAVPAAEPIERHRHFDYPVRDRHLLATVVYELLAEAVALVEARGQAIARVLCRFQAPTNDLEGRGSCRAEAPPAESARQEPRPPSLRPGEQNNEPDRPAKAERAGAQLEARLLQASVSLPRIWELVDLQLERAVLPAEVWHVRLRVVAAPLVSEQETFFDAATQQNRRELTALLERLGSRLGQAAVLRARATTDAQPEFAVRLESVGSRQKAVGSKQKAAGRELHPVTLSSPRPLHLEPRPQEVAALSVVPDGPPVRFHWQGAEHNIEQAWGPERIETGWWRQRYVRRDYYLVETQTGHRFWLFRNLDDGLWFLHGSFE